MWQACSAQKLRELIDERHLRLHDPPRRLFEIEPGGAVHLGKLDTADLTAIANTAEALAVIVAVAFGIAQVGQLRAQRRREAMFALVRSVQTPEMIRALVVLDSLPEGLSKAELEERLGPDVLAVHYFLGVTPRTSHAAGAADDVRRLPAARQWESLGIMVFHREVTLDLVDDFYSGSIVHSWRKLHRLVEDVRRETDRDTRWEWFQWLAERMIERETRRPPVPAYVAFGRR